MTATQRDRRVLVTGANGVVAQAVVKALRDDGCWVRGLDLDQPEGVDDAIADNIAEAGVMDRAVEGIDTVIHLAAHPEDGELVEELLEPNVAGLCRVLEAARHAQTPRLILASSMQVVHGLDDETPLTAEHANPCNRYALTKRWAEIAGEMYARKHGLTVLMVRIGWLPRTVERALKVPKADAEDIYLSDRDAGRFFTAAVRATLEPGSYHILYAVSRPGGPPRVDPSIAEERIGYTPVDVYPEGYETENKAV
jgi:NAD(P)-dependent dehydrogenase (short-subunit alcohol dehydrogenase family)